MYRFFPRPLRDYKKKSKSPSFQLRLQIPKLDGHRRELYFKYYKKKEDHEKAKTELDRLLDDGFTRLQVYRFFRDQEYLRRRSQSHHRDSSRNWKFRNLMDIENNCTLNTTKRKRIMKRRRQNWTDCWMTDSLPPGVSIFFRLKRRKKKESREEKKVRISHLLLFSITTPTNRITILPGKTGGHT